MPSSPNHTQDLNLDFRPNFILPCLGQVPILVVATITVISGAAGIRDRYGTIWSVTLLLYWAAVLSAWIASLRTRLGVHIRAGGISGLFRNTAREIHWQELDRVVFVNRFTVSVEFSGVKQDLFSGYYLPSFRLAPTVRAWLRSIPSPPPIVRAFRMSHVDLRMPLWVLLAYVSVLSVNGVLLPICSDVFGAVNPGFFHAIGINEWMWVLILLSAIDDPKYWSCAKLHAGVIPGFVVLWLTVVDSGVRSATADVISVRLGPLAAFWAVKVMGLVLLFAGLWRKAKADREVFENGLNRRPG